VALKGTDWSGCHAPTLDDIEALASAALRDLPEPFASLAADVTCSVAEFAEDDVLEGFGMESPFELMGLFTGIGLTEDGAVPQTGQLPNTVYSIVVPYSTTGPSMTRTRWARLSPMC
jgi:Uncharacterized protein conserved in bacteria